MKGSLSGFREWIPAGKRKVSGILCGHTTTYKESDNQLYCIICINTLSGDLEHVWQGRDTLRNSDVMSWEECVRHPIWNFVCGSQIGAGLDLFVFKINNYERCFLCSAERPERRPCNLHLLGGVREECFRCPRSGIPEIHQDV